MTDIYNTCKNLYENTLQKGETFSDEMVEHIREELDKMLKQKEEYDKKKKMGEAE